MFRGRMLKRKMVLLHFIFYTSEGPSLKRVRIIIYNTCWYVSPFKLLLKLYNIRFIHIHIRCSWLNASPMYLHFYVFCLYSSICKHYVWLNIWASLEHSNIQLSRLVTRRLVIILIKYISIYSCFVVQFI